MQESLSTSPTWLQTAFGWVASFIVGGTIFKIIDIWLNRKKPAAELQVTQATASEITVRSHSTAGDAIIRMMGRLDAAQTTIDRLRTERDKWQDEYDKAFTERDEFLRQNGLLKEEIKSYENQIRTMQATLTFNNKNYDNTQDVELPGGGGK